MSHSKENGKSWRLDDMYIGFVQSETRYLDIPYHRGRVGFNHLAFHATSRHQVDEITRKLRDRGITILYSSMLTSTHSPVGRNIMLFTLKAQIR